MDVHRLRVFRSVVASGSIQAAATQLGYTASAVSQHVTALQRETGLQLVERVGRGIAPTAAGRLLAERSDDAMDALARLDGMVAGMREGHAGRLTVACFASAGEEWVPLLAQRLRRDYAVPLEVTLNEILAEQLPARADIDLRTEDPVGPPLHLPGYDRHELLVEPYLVVVALDHDLARRGTVRLGELAGEPLVAANQDQQVCWAILQRAFSGAGVSPRYVAHCQDHHATLAMVAAGLGATLVPRLVLGAVPATCRVLDVTDPTPVRRVTAHVRQTDNPAVGRAAEILRELAGRD